MFYNRFIHKLDEAICRTVSSDPCKGGNRKCNIKQLATAGAALTVMGLLAGCGTTNGTTSSTESNNASASITSTVSPKDHSNSSKKLKTGASNVRTPNVPQWFLQDVKIAEHANLSTGANYILYYGSSPSFNVNNAMTHSWFGVYRGMGKPIDFGTNLQVIYQTLQSDPRQYGELSNIHVMEQTQQSNKPTGEVVSAMCVNVGNGDYVAFANNQIITASDNSGYIRYTVHSLKGIRTD